jgi:hypothetical protein
MVFTHGLAWTMCYRVSYAVTHDELYLVSTSSASSCPLHVPFVLRGYWQVTNSTILITSCSAAVAVRTLHIHVLPLTTLARGDCRIQYKLYAIHVFRFQVRHIGFLNNHGHAERARQRSASSRHNACSLSFPPCCCFCFCCSRRRCSYCLIALRHVC